MITGIISDILIIVGLLFMTLGIVGMIRMPDIYTKMHAASKSVFLGVISVAASAMLVGDLVMNMRLVLLSVMVLITTPVAAHVIGRGAYLHRDRMATEGALDESAHNIVDDSVREPSWRL